LGTNKRLFAFPVPNISSNDSQVLVRETLF